MALQQRAPDDFDEARTRVETAKTDAQTLAKKRYISRLREAFTEHMADADPDKFIQVSRQLLSDLDEDLRSVS